MSKERFLYFYRFLNGKVFETERKMKNTCKEGYVMEYSIFPEVKNVVEFKDVDGNAIICCGTLVVILSKKSMNTAIEKMINFNNAKIDKLKEEIKEIEEDVYALEKYIDERKE